MDKTPPEQSSSGTNGFLNRIITWVKSLLAGISSRRDQRPTYIIHERPRKTVDISVLGDAILVKVVNPILTLDNKTEAVDSNSYASAENMEAELRWLLGAAEHLLKICWGEIDPGKPISVPIPESVPDQSNASNTLIGQVEHLDLGILSLQIDGMLERIKIHIRNLDMLLKREAIIGPEGKEDVYLQNQLRHTRLEIVKILQEIEHFTYKIYGVHVNTPNQLFQLLDQL
ncbi:MAG: hypothetical protein GY797_37300 [Deltaproteobacteria bacterium]|nr:hypothetical protein [Deltaproteobacteria bacterium]